MFVSYLCKTEEGKKAECCGWLWRCGQGAGTAVNRGSSPRRHYRSRGLARLALSRIDAGGRESPGVCQILESACLRFSFYTCLYDSRGGDFQKRSPLHKGRGNKAIILVIVRRRLRVRLFDCNGQLCGSRHHSWRSLPRLPWRGAFCLLTSLQNALTTTRSY